MDGGEGRWSCSLTMVRTSGFVFPDTGYLLNVSQALTPSAPTAQEGQAEANGPVEPTLAGRRRVTPLEQSAAG